MALLCLLMELEDIDVTGNGLISKKVVSRIAGKKMIGLYTDLRGCMRYKFYSTM